MARGAKELVLVVGATVATVIGADALLQRVAPLLPRRMEAEDAIRQLERGDPETLLVGSSHGRSFLAIAEAVSQASEGRRAMVSVPVEYGKVSSYEWILERRLRPLLDELGSDGRPRRSALRRFVLVTEWWDHCSPGEGLAFNVPARGFTFRDFAFDVARNGITLWNQNYVDQKWALLFRPSILFQDRGVGRVPEALRRLLGTTDGADPRREESERRKLAVWRDAVEAGATDPLCHDGRELAAMERIFDWAQGRSLDVTLLLFPRKPATLTPRARETTLARFSAEMAAVAGRRGIRFVDYTVLPVIGDGDFMADFDHLTVEGNQKLRDWALARELAFLLEPAPRAVSTALPVGP